MKRKIRKLRGGGMDASKSDFNVPSTKFTPSPGDTGGEGGNVSNNKTVRSGGSNTINTIKNKVSGLQIKGPSIALSLAKQFVFDPITKANRLRRAKGNMLIGDKKMPITRDYYRTENKPLDVMSKDGIQYQKDARLISDKIPLVVRGDSEAQQKCPDGTFPPCITADKINTNVVKPKNFFNFKAYNKGGGVPYGPPPKKGPNSQVPPVKLSRGGGAAIRGTKFKGVF
jgi:hypothetical protein